jgi:hypothetical protein
LEELVPLNVSGLSTTFSTKSLSRLETRERGTGPKIDEPVATLLNAESRLLRDAVSVGVVALGLKDIPAFIKSVDLDEPRTFGEPLRDGNKNGAGGDPFGKRDSDSITGESSEIVWLRFQRFCA